VAALALLSPAEPEQLLSPHHLDVAPHLLSDNHVVPEAAAEPLMMAQPVPHQTTDKKRVKVYELRQGDWFDRGTGFCFACFVPVCCPTPMPHASPTSP
jgi:protein phosphatase-4 regulatory subunit 3